MPDASTPDALTLDANTPDVRSPDASTPETSRSDASIAAAIACGAALPSSRVVNVRDTGATGNGITNDTAAIQVAVDQVGGTGGTVLVPDGTYMIDAIAHLDLKSNMTLCMASGAVLQAIPNNKSNYAVVKISNKINVNVVGGTIQGERHRHLTAGDFVSSDGDQWGMGLWIQGSSNVNIDGVTAKECWGDGFYQSGEPPQSKNITIQNVTADDNRRQGLSIENVDGMTVKNSIFKNTKGQAPMAGIDVEPFAPNQNVTNLTIVNNEIFGNYGDGIAIDLRQVAKISRNIIIENNNIHNNPGFAAIQSADAGPGLIIRNNNVHDNSLEGIYIQSSTGVQVTGNTVSNNTEWAIVLASDSSGNTVTGNTMTGNGTNPVRDVVGGNSISPNFTTLDTSAPSIPTGVAAIAVSSRQINLTWTASSDDRGVFGYRLERCFGASCTTFTQIAAPYSNSHSDTVLTAGAYTYRVRAVDVSGNLSGYSGDVSAPVTN